MRGLNLLVKPTHMCNFECKYCYDSPYRTKYGNLVMSGEVAEALAALMHEWEQEQGVSCNLIWHGGEPLMAGKEWFRTTALVLEREAGPILSMQSNGSLLDSEWVNLLTSRGIRIGVSYDFQGQGLRGEFSLSDKLELFRGTNGGVDVGSITVITPENADSMVDIFVTAQKMFSGLVCDGIAFNFMFSAKGVQDNALKALDAFDLASRYSKFLNFYVYQNQEAFSERTSELMLSAVFGLTPNLCTYKDCRGAWLSIAPNGDIYPCDRWYPDRYLLGNVMCIDSFKEVFRTKNYKQYYREIQQRLSTICSSCHLLPVCNGGCNGTHLAKTGTLTGVDVDVCLQMSTLFRETYMLLRSIDLNSMNINRHVYSRLVRLKCATLNEIYLFLREELNYYEVLNTAGEYNDSIEYKVFRAINHFRFDAESMYFEHEMNMGVRVQRTAWLKERFALKKVEIASLLAQNSELNRLR